jgi:hypothetical protein
MTRFVPAAILVFACAICAGARSAPSSGPPAARQSSSPPPGSSDSANIPVGTEIVGTLSTKLDSKHSKTGDPVEVEVTQDVLDGNRVVLRRGSRITGHVTDVSAFAKKVTNARLEIVFDTIIPKNGAQISTYLALYALAAKHDDASDNIQDPRGLDATSATAGVAGGLGGPAGGILKPDSKGVYNLDGLSLAPMARDNPPTSLVHSQSRDIRLDKGTEIVLVAEGSAPPSGRSSN